MVLCVFFLGGVSFMFLLFRGGGEVQHPLVGGLDWVVCGCEPCSWTFPPSEKANPKLLGNSLDAAFVDPL